MKKCLSILLCLCMLLSQASAYATEVVSDNYEAPTVELSDASPAAAVSYNLEDWCVDGSLVLQLLLVDENGATTEIHSGDVVPDGAKVRISVAGSLNASTSDTAESGLVPDDVLEMAFPDGISYGNTSEVVIDELGFSVEDGKMLVRLTQAFFDNIKTGSYSFNGNIDGTLSSSADNGSGKAEFTFPGGYVVTVRFQPDVTSTKGVARNVYRGDDGNWYADYAITVSSTEDLASATVTDTLGSWLTLDPESIRLNGSHLSADAVNVTNNVATIALGALTHGENYTLTYTAQVSADAFEEANGVIGISNNNTTETDANRVNTAHVDWEATNELTGKTEDDDARVTYERTDNDISKGNGGVMADAPTPYVDYNVNVTVNDTTDTLTLTDVRGSWLKAGAENVTLMALNAQGARVTFTGDPLTATAANGTTFTVAKNEGQEIQWNITNANSGFYQITYRVYVNDNAFVETGDGVKNLNTATLTWGDTSKSATSTINANRVPAINKNHYTTNEFPTRDNTEYRRVRYVLDFTVAPLDVSLSEVKVTDDYDPRAILELPILVTQKGDRRTVYYSLGVGNDALTIDNDNSKFVVDFSKIPDLREDLTADNIQLVYTMLLPRTMGTINYQNTATIDAGNRSDTVEHTTAITTQPTINKTFLSGDTSGELLTARWQSTMVIPTGESLENAYFVDHGSTTYNSNQNMYFSAETVNLEITMGGRTLDAGTDYSVTIGTANGGVENNSLRVDFNIPISGEIVIRYTTLIKRDAIAQGAVLNTCGLFWGNNSVTANDEWHWGVRGEVPFRKAASDAYQGEDGQWYIDWTINTDYGYQGIINQQVTVIDPLPSGLSYVPGTAEYTNYNYNNNPTEEIPDTAFTTLDSGNQLFSYTFTANSIGMFIIKFTTLVDTSSAGVNESFQHVYDNIASLLDRNNDHLASAYAQADIEIEANRALIKEGVQAYDRVEYTIRVNSGAADLDPGKDYLTLGDTLPDHIAFQPNSLSVRTQGGGRLTRVTGEPGAGEYSYTFDSDSKRLTIMVPDQAALTVVFQAQFMKPTGTVVTLSNAIELEGLNITATTGEQTFTVQDSQFNVVSHGYTLTINKSNIQNGAPVAGASFAVYQVRTAGTSISVIPTAVVTGVTDARGRIVLPENSTLRPDVLYCVQETRPAPGYAPSEKTYYFIFQGSDTAYYNAQVAAYYAAMGDDAELYELAGSTTISWTNRESTEIDITFGKRWDDEGNENARPHSVRVTLYRRLVTGGDAESVREVTFNVSEATGNEGQYTFSETVTDLPTMNDDDVLYEYFVEEDMLNEDGTPFTSDLYAASVDGYYAVNTYKKPIVNIYKSFYGLADDAPLPVGTELELYVYENGVLGTQLAAWTVTNETLLQTISQETLPEALRELWVYGGTYLLREAAVPEGYYEMADVVFTIQPGEGSNGTQISVSDGTADIDGNQLTLVNQPTTRTVDVTVIKVWQDVDGSTLSGTPPEVTMTLTANGSDYGDPITLPYQGEYSYTWEDLPYMIGGEVAIYAVRETESDAFAQVNDTGLIDQATGNLSYTFTNRLNSRVTVAKVDANGAPLAGATLRLEKMFTADATQVESLVEEWTTNESNNPRTFMSLLGVYRLSEVSAPDDTYQLADPITFTVAADGTITRADGIAVESATITMMNVIIQNVSVNVSKEWKRYDDATTPDAVTVVLERSTDDVNFVDVYDASGSLMSLTLNEDNNWRGSFEDLPRFDGDTRYYYRVREVAVDGYEPSYMVSSVTPDRIVTNITITNTATTTGGTFSKQAIAGTEELAGAQLILTDVTDGDNEQLVEQWTSSDQPHVIGTDKLVIGHTYELTEITAPNGYAVAESITFTVTLNADDTVSFHIDGQNTGDREVVMKDAPLSMSIAKVSKAGTSSFVSGATLRLEDVDAAQTVATWTTAAELHPITSGLIGGHTYRLEETTTPAGYIPAAPITFVLGTDGRAYQLVENEPVYFTDNLIEMVNEPFTLTVDKLNEQGARLAGATIALYEGDEVAGSPIAMWDTNGAIYTLPDNVKLVFGNTYTLHEVTSPSGYACAPDITFTVSATLLSTARVDENGVHVLYYSMIDQPIEATFEKRALSETGAFLAGVTLTLTCAEDRDYLETWTTTDSETVHTVQGLVVGNTYTFTETVVPDGYRQSQPITFRVQRDGTLLRANADGVFNVPIPNNCVVMVNNATGNTSLVVEKVWDDRGVENVTHPQITVQLTRALEGTTEFADVEGERITLPIIGEDSSESWRYTFSNLPLTDKEQNPYTYAAYEVETLSGYTSDEPVATTTESGFSVTLTNRYRYTNGTFSKRDATGAEELEGATLQLYDGATKIAEWVSGTEPTLLDDVLLEIGKQYTLVETIAPEGYAVATESVVFEVGEDAQTHQLTFTLISGDNVGEVDDGVIVMKDAPLDVTVLKTDENGAPLAGATLALYEGNQRVAQWVSGTEAIRLSALAEDGYLFKRNTTYTLREVTPPAGYAVAEDVTFTLDQASNVAVKAVTMSDRAIELGVQKTDENGAALTGAQMALYRAPIATGDAPLATWMSSTEEWLANRDGGVTLVYGQSYIIRELLPPAGYTAAADILVTLDADTLANATASTTHFTIHRTMQDQPNAVSILKLDAQTNRPLAGARLSLSRLDASGAVVELITEWTTTLEPLVLTGRLVPGTRYQVTELSAPDGYEVATSYRFTMTADATVERPLTITISDPHVYTFSKLTLGNNYVVNARLAIYDSNNREIASWRTGNSDYQLVGTLRVGQTYTLREVYTPEGYETADPITFTINVNGFMVLGSNANNTTAQVSRIVMYDQPVEDERPRPKYMDLSVQKRWEDVDNVMGLRPASITLYLYQKLQSAATYPAEPLLTVILTPSDQSSNVWRFTFEDLECYNDNGVDYQYMVREEPVEGYEVRYQNNGRTIINSVPEEDIRPTPTPTLPVVTPTPTPTQTVPAGVRFVDGHWVYIDENGVPLGEVPQTGDDTNWLLWGAAIVLPLLIAAVAMVEVRRRKRRAALQADRNDE